MQVGCRDARREWNSAAPAVLSLVSCLPPARAASTQYDWKGIRSSDISDPANWDSGAIPAFGTSINEVFWDQVSGAGNAMTYTASQGNTTFTLPNAWLTARATAASNDRNSMRRFKNWGWVRVTGSLAHDKTLLDVCRPRRARV